MPKISPTTKLRQRHDINTKIIFVNYDNIENLLANHINRSYIILIILNT